MQHKVSQLMPKRTRPHGDICLGCLSKNFDVIILWGFVRMGEEFSRCPDDCERRRRTLDYM